MLLHVSVAHLAYHSFSIFLLKVMLASVSFWPLQIKLLKNILIQVFCEHMVFFVWARFLGLSLKLLNHSFRIMDKSRELWVEKLGMVLLKKVEVSQDLKEKARESC